MPSSKLQRQTSFLLHTFLSSYDIRENVRPDWLITPQGERLELDFLLEELDIAIEVQGTQHYIYSPHFHGDHDGFTKQIRFDRFKRLICDRRGIRLIEVSTIEEAETAVLDLSASVSFKSIRYEIPEHIRKTEEEEAWKERVRHTRTLVRRTEERIARLRVRMIDSKEIKQKHLNLLERLEKELRHRRQKLSDLSY